MIIKFKIFEQAGNESLYKVGDTVYYHGRLGEYHGYYVIFRVEFDRPRENGDTGWRYYIRNNSRGETIHSAWEMSLSPNEEEGRIKDKEFHQRKDDLRKLHLDHDPYGEEIWESVHEIDPYGEEEWVEKEWVNVPEDYLLKKGDKVKISPDSPYHTDRGVNARLYRFEGEILNDRKRKPTIAFCWDVRFDNGQTRNYRTKDLMMLASNLKENVSDIDPYGEENWDDKKVPHIDYDDEDRERYHYRRVDDCRLCGRYYPNALMLDGVCPACRAENEIHHHCLSCGSYVPDEFLEDGLCDKCIKEPGWDI